MCRSDFWRVKAIVQVFSDILIFMKVGNYGKGKHEEKLTRIMPRIRAQFEAEKAVNPDAFYPFGYARAFTAKSVRDLLGRKLSQMEQPPPSIDVVFSPRSDARQSWKDCCRKGCFPVEFDLGPKKNAWRHMDAPVRGSRLFPERYPPYGENKRYYALLIENIELFDSPTDDVWIDLKPYRRMTKKDNKGRELRGQWRKLSAIPCFKVEKPAKEPKYPEPVIARAKLVEPYAVELSPEPFERTP